MKRNFKLQDNQDVEKVGEDQYQTINLIFCTFTQGLCWGIFCEPTKIEISSGVVPYRENVMDFHTNNKSISQ